LYHLAQESQASWPKPDETDLTVFSGLFELSQEVDREMNRTGLESGMTKSCDQSVLKALRGFIKKRRASGLEHNLAM
jgi:hypothetical protein